MNAPSHNAAPTAEREMIHYLLGQMTTEERTAFEERYFADEALFEELTLVKEELLDRHAHGQLSNAESAQLERQFGASATGREQLAFAQTLRQALAEPANNLRTEPPAQPTRPHWLSSLTWWNWTWAAAAACLLLALLWQWKETRQLRGELSALQTRQAEQAELAQRLTEELQRLRVTPSHSPAALPPAPTVSPTPASRVLANALVSLQLLPSVRSGGDVAVAQMPADTEFLALQLQLDFAPTPRSCRATLVTAAGTPIIPATRLTERSNAAGFTLPWQIPARKLSPGEYKVNLNGHDREHNEDVTLTYRFRVEQP